MPNKKCPHGKRKDTCFSCNPASSLGYLVRARLNGHFLSSILKAQGSAVQYLGCSYTVYKKYLEDRFEDEYGKPLNWDKFHQKYSIEHVIPLHEGASDIELLKLLFHFSNTCVMRLDLNESRGCNGIHYDTWLLCNRFGAIKI